MSCAPGAGVFVKLWKLFVDIHRWALVKMSVNCKTSSLNGILPPSVKLRKQKDLLHGPNDFRKWRRKLLCLCILAAITISCIWFFLRSGNGALGRKNNSPHSCEEKSQVCLQRFNVSKNQFHDLASLVYESDQIVSLQCSKDPGTKMSVTDGIACVLKTLCPTKQEIQLQGGWVGELVGLNNQCPLFDENTHGNINHSSVDDSLPFVSDSIPQDGGKNTLQTKEGGNYAVDHCKFCSLGLLKECWWLLVGMIVSCTFSGFHLKFRMRQKEKLVQHKPLLQQRQAMVQLKQQQPPPSPPKAAGKLMKTLLVLFVMAGITGSIWLFLHMHHQNVLRREETLSNMCDERARMLQDQFNVSMNHVHALAILVSTFHHGKNPSAIDQKTFSEYTERTSFERPLTSGVAYALKVTHSEREQFEKEHRWTIKKMGTDDQTLVRDCIPHKLDPAPDQDEYAPVIFSQETVSHIVSIDMMSGKEDRENILRARASGKGVLTSPFKLLKSNHLGVVLTFAVYNADLPPDATPEERIEATVGYLGASYDIPSLVEKLLQQLASKQTIVVNVYDTTNASAPILMYGTDVIDTGLLRISNLDYGDPLRKHEMHCRFKQKALLPWTAIIASMGALIITLLIGHIFHAAINRIAKVEEDYREMMELKARAEAADVAKSQFLATVSHEIRTPMNGVLGMLQMLMGTNLDAEQMEYAQTAHGSGKDLISIINEVLDQAKIESGRLELEAVPFDLRSVLDNVQLLFSGKSNEKEIELAIYVSNLVPDVVIGDPGRFRQIITNLVGNSIKFTKAGHVFVSVHLAEEVRNRHDVKDTVLKQALSLVEDTSTSNYNTVSGFPVVDRWKSWENFKSLSSNVEEPEMIRLLVTVEDTGVGIQKEAQSRIFTPFVQADSSTSRTYGGTGIGLSISKCLVDLMGGEIGFVSELNNGSTFSFTVSFRKGQSSSLDTKWQSCSPVDSEFRGWRALIIDKRIIRAEVTRYHLQRLGISVDISPSLQSACSYLSGASCKSVPADYAMVLVDKDVWDKETGITFYHLLKETKENGGAKVPLNLPKIFLLATTLSPDERSELKSIGLVEKVLTRPLRLSVFINSFQEALGNGRKSPVNRRKPVTLQTLLRDRRILVVDDNRVNRKVAEGALKKYGAIVTCVNSGKEALEMLKPPHKFDACFMDLQMPEMDGFEATEKIRAMETEVNEQIASGEASMEMIGNVRYWRTPILAMTADVIQATNEKCLKCGMDDYVSKPFEEEQLYNAVARFFESG